MSMVESDPATLTEMPSGEDDLFVFPMSYAQQRLWFLDQLESGNPAFNVCAVFWLRGTIDKCAFQAAIQSIVDRHEALRTTFAVLDGEPSQVVAARLLVPVVSHDVTGRGEPARVAAAMAHAAAAIRQPFDLSQGPLLRAELVRTAPDEHLFVFVAHHIVFDGWSWGILLAELSSAYAAAREGDPSPLSELTIQYPDYAVWQREWLQDDVLEEQLRYWKQVLQDAPPPLDLPKHLPLSESKREGRGEHRTFELPSGLFNQVQALAREEGATLFMAMLGAYATLLYRYTGQHDLVVGAPVASRTRAELEELIGCFMNPVPLRLRLDGRPGFREVLKRVREACLGAFANQDVPFDEIVRALGLKRDLTTLPLFQVMFLLQDFYWQRFDLAGLDVERVIPEGDILAYPLSLDMGRAGEKLIGRLEFLPEFAHLAGQTPEHLITLLEAAARDPEQPIELLPILGGPERHKLLVDWQGEHSDAGNVTSIHELFEAQAQLTPDRAAVKFGSASLTYAELNARANQLAHLLREHGIGPESRVGVLLERCEQMPVAIMAVLKAGGAYVPLDTRYPQERLRHILQDADIKVLITHRVVRRGDLADSIDVICLDTDRDAIGRQSTANSQCDAGGNHLAYLIYTSGSTGAPKGTMIERCSLVNAYLAWERSYRLREDTRVHLQMASMSFDVFSGDLSRALCSGGTLVIAPQELLLAPERLYALMRQEGVDCAEFVPVVFRELLDYLERTGQSLAFMRLIAVGSDLWYVHEFRRALGFCGPQTRLVNSYGLTEATIDSTWYEADSELPAEGLVPIGKPFANTELYILDAYQQPVPVGAAGELYIGGPGLARGYVHQPELTREKFVPHLFSDLPGARLYRTGDRARWMRNGCVEFLGRGDNQVKLRGYRIELAEIESVLGHCEGVARAAVLVREDVPGDQRLVAYVVPRGEEAPSAAELRRLLSARLPEQMIPSAFVSLETMPLTPNGKVDRKALPAPEHGNPDADAAYVAPRSPVEERLAELYCELLKVPRVGAHDNFFLLGGHSLLATRLVSRIRETFGVEVPLRSLFESAVVQDLARETQARMDDCTPAGAGASNPPPIEPADRSGALELSFAQQRMWFLQQLEPDSIAYHLPSATRLRGSIDIVAMRRTFQRIAERHETLRTVFRETEGRATQSILPEAVVPLTVIDLSYIEPAEAREAEVARHTSEAVSKPFDFAKPLWRVTLLRLAVDDHVLVFVAHHAISDGWSMAVFVREFGAIYRAQLEAAPDGLPPLSIQYADYALWQRRQMTGELDRQLSYWRDKLAGAPPALDLPTDRPRPARATGRGARHVHRLDDRIVAAINELARSSGTTQSITLLAAFNVLLHRYTGQRDILIGSPVANRTRREVENLIGFFANTLIYRTDITGDPSFTELLTRVRNTALEAYSNQDLPFERLVNELKVERDLSLTPLFQVMFVLQDAKDVKLELPGVSLEMMPVGEVAAKFDITLTVSETSQGTFAEYVYSTDLFDNDSIARLAKRFEMLLGSIAADPAAPVAALNLMPDAERDMLRRMSTGPTRDYSLATPVHELISDRAQQWPEHVAAADEHGHLTYAELERRTAALALHLRGRGVDRGDRVAICVERSTELLVAVLGAIKAGAGYLPLDPGYPPKRLRMMLGDADPACVIAHAPTVEVLASLRSAQSSAKVVDDLVMVDRPETWAVPDPRSMPQTEPAGPDDPVYLLYTSGSTGNPKGVISHHRGIVNRILGMQESFQLQQDDVMLQKTPAGFDVSVWELLWPLLAGAKIVFARPEGHRDPHYLAETIVERRVTTMHFVPSMLRAFLEGVPQDVLARCGQSLRRVFSGGEALSFELKELFFERLPGVRLFNQYGPTEAAVDVTLHECRPGGTRRAVPIGKPVQNVQIHILDKHLQPLPPRLPGELHIGGVQVATGYLGRPELTAVHFISDPFDPSGRGRLYKTGDLARWAADGEIEFLGRLDHQVKIRGQRIEPGEVEQALMALTLSEGRFRQVAVIAQTKGGADDAHLVAYLVMDDAAARPAIEDVRDGLAAVLPEGWIPSHFMFIDALPIGPNGKLDRRMLPKPAEAAAADEGDGGWTGRSALREAYVAPRTPVESELAAVWRDVLKLPRIGVHDNFFALGGDSIISIQIIARARSAGMEIKPRDMFQRQTIAELAEVVSAPALRNVPAQPPVTHAPRSTVQPLMFGPADAPLYGCFHAPTGPSDGTAVLICQPVGYEFIRCHRCLRNLAQRLAAKNLPVLRFDYMGCGDSAGDAEDVSLEAWLTSVAAASKELRRRTEVRRLVVVGLRFGATLAAIAAAKGLLDADRLVLWQPFITGQSSLTVSQAAHERHTTWSAKEFGELPADVPPEQLGYRWSQQLMSDLQRLDLMQLPAAHSRRALIVDNAEERAFTDFARHLATGGSRVETAHVPDPGIWDAEPYLAAMPYASVERIISWISGEQS